MKVCKVKKVSHSSQKTLIEASSLYFCNHNLQIKVSTWKLAQHDLFKIVCMNRTTRIEVYLYRHNANANANH